MIPISDRIPTRRFPLFTVLFILINIAVFGYQIMVQATGGERALQRLVYTYGIVPARIAENGLDAGVLLSLVTSMFMHGGLLHLLGNMLYLWIFGNNIEDVLGHVWFVIFYFAAGFAASFAQVFMSWGSDIPGIGASGAIAGVLAAYLVFFPHAQINTLLILGFFAFIRRIPALFVLGFWFVLQLINGFASLGQMQMGGVAFFAHVGGFVAGLVLAIPWIGKARRIGSRIWY